MRLIAEPPDGIHPAGHWRLRAGAIDHCVDDRAAVDDRRHELLGFVAARIRRRRGDDHDCRKARSGVAQDSRGLGGLLQGAYVRRRIDRQRVQPVRQHSPIVVERCDYR